MNTRYVAGIVFVLFLVGAGVLLANRQKEVIPETGKLNVVTSFYPLYFFAKEIGGDRAQVVNITPAGAEPHDYEPTSQDVMRIIESSLLVLNGGGLEAWGAKVSQIIDPKKTLVITASDGLTNRQTAENGQNITDPHIWLSPPLAQKLVGKITQGFMQADSANAAYYKDNSDALITKLGVLDASYRKRLGTCTQRNIVTAHSAFGYLAAAYGLKQISIAGLSPDAEPSIKKLGEIARLARESNVKYIFFESLVSPKLAQVLASEIGAETMVLNPLEGLSDSDIAAGKNYFTVMQDNLINLETALGCVK